MRFRSAAVAAAVLATTAGCATEAPRVPVGSRVVFVGDYDTGDLTQWATLQTHDWSQFAGDYCTYRACVHDDGAGHSTAARFEVRDGDVPPFGGGERAEVRTGDGPSSGGYAYEGDERWYEMSVKFDENFRNPRVSSAGWFIVMQWFGYGAPALALQVSESNTLEFGGDGVPRRYHRPIGEVRPGEWVDYILHVKFSKIPSVGFVEAWADGVLVLPRYNRPTMTTESSYLKQGIYRDANAGGTQVVWHDGLRVTAP